jgi:peroxiredoxin
MLKAGDTAPGFELESDGGSKVKLSSLRGKAVVLHFYPKDDASGCTKGTCSFRDSWGAVEASGAAAFGISLDWAERHFKFKAKFDLPFPLLADEDKVFPKVKSDGHAGEVFAAGVLKEKLGFRKIVALVAAVSGAYVILGGSGSGGA